MAHLPILILSGALFLALVLACALCAAHCARAAARPSDTDLAYVRDVLLLARREFDFHGGCVATDRPDLPLAPETSWTVDFSRVRAAIDAASDLLDRAARQTGHECGRCSSRLANELLSTRSKYAPAPSDSHTRDPGCS
ncbi:hypothetical protein [Delftia sp. SD018]|uniref:hypothetical protein n=1 Tax=Delftia sp. SD018 TaxID=2781389 RepID=UPI001F60897A|nr:hypothetical protein [Delftia sp. SD018]